MSNHPFAVYGTLRAGESNSWLLAGRVEREEARVDGYELVLDGGLPFALPRAGGRLVVELVWPLVGLYDQVLASLDRLEGYDPDLPESDNFYLRRRVDAHTGGGEAVTAWLYVPSASTRRSLLYATPVPSGDYTRRAAPTDTWSWETV